MTARATLVVPRDFSLEATVLSHGYVQTAPFACADRRLERVDRLRPGEPPRSVGIEQQGRELSVQVRGVRRVPPEYLARVRRMLQLDVAPRTCWRSPGTSKRGASTPRRSSARRPG